MYDNVMRGSDPELFLMDVHGKVASSIGLIGGSKGEPRPISNGCALQEDNVAVEFNIPPARDVDSFVSSLTFALDFIKDEVAKHGLKPAILATADFTAEQLSHPKAQEFGCTPDFNVWTLTMNPRPEPPKSLRSCGGHLHLSWDNPTPQEQTRVIKAHDLFCGVWSLMYDEDRRRREIYGKAGAYRPKMYGVEYRTLSNFWIRERGMMKALYEQSEKAFNFLRNGGRILAEDGAKIQKCINESNFALMAELNEKFAIVG